MAMWPLIFNIDFSELVVESRLKSLWHSIDEKAFSNEYIEICD